MKLEEFEIFKGINNNTYQNEFKIISYNKEDMLFNEGDECTHLSFVIEGAITVRTYSLNGKEEIINTLLPGDIFGDVICFSKKKTYIGHIISEKHSTIAHIHKDKWIQLLQCNSNLLINFLESITNKTFQTKMENKILTHKNIENRIYYYLNTKINHQKEHFIFIKSVTDLSKTLNLPRPSVSRSLTQMEKKGLIRKTKNKIEVL